MGFRQGAGVERACCGSIGIVGHGGDVRPVKFALVAKDCEFLIDQPEPEQALATECAFSDEWPGAVVFVDDHCEVVWVLFWKGGNYFGGAAADYKEYTCKDGLAAASAFLSAEAANFATHWYGVRE
jgi:hypothetical protein